MQKQAMRARLMETVRHLLSQGSDPATLTSRGIGAAANVSPAMINYCWGGKDALVSAAIEEQIGEAAERFRSAPPDGTPPRERLRTMLWELSELVVQYRQYTKTTIPYALLHGEIEAPRYILPLIRVRFEGKKNETECRILAHALISSVTLAYFREDAFERYAGLDLRDREARRRLLDMLLDLLLGGNTHGTDRLPE